MNSSNPATAGFVFGRERRAKMNKNLLTLTGIAVAAGLAAGPVDARTYSNVIKCSGWRNGQCVAWNRLTTRQSREIQVGYVFPQNYTYTEFSALPQPLVTEYNLSPDARYVYSNGYIWVIDPHTYAVTRVIVAPGG
jgi:hypothetical protein